MTLKALLLSLSISVVLAIIAVIVLLPELRGPGVDDQPVLDLRLSDVTSLQLQESDGRERTIARYGSDWVLRWLVDGDDEETRWPAQAGNARGSIRLLLESLERDSEGLELATGEATLSLGTENGSWQIEFGTSRVGGQTAARVTRPDGETIEARIATRVRDVFTVEGMMAWRAPQASALLTSGVDRIYLQSKDLVPIRLALQNGRWSLLEPLATRAEDARCRDLQLTLQRLTAAQFHDDLDVTSPGTELAEPGAIIAIEKDVVGEPGARLLTGLAIGALTNLEATHVYVAMEQRRVEVDGSASILFGPVVASVPVQQVNTIVPDPRAYLSRRTLEASIPDVRRLEVTRRGRSPEVFHRNVTGWQSGRGVPPLSTVSEALDDLLRILTTTSAAQVELAPPEGWTEIGVVEAREGEGASLGRVGLAVIERDGQPVALATQIDGVARLFPVDVHLGLLTWLRDTP